ncbi:MAG: cobalt transporter CbiM [bacterium]
MHIPDGFLSPITCITCYAAIIPFWIIFSKKVQKGMNTQLMSYAALGASFSFLIMMINIPIPGGTCGHATGTALLSLLFGPEYAFILVSLALAIQALIFGDGGITTYGANVISMALIPSYIAHYLNYILGKLRNNTTLCPINSAISAYFAIVSGALFTSVILGVQPYFFHSATGLPMFFPYGLNVTIPAMLIPHILVFGSIEGVITSLVIKYLATSNNLLNLQVDE